MVAGRGESTRGRGRGASCEEANAAKRKAPLEAKQASDAEVRADVQEDAHQVSMDEVLEEASGVVAGESGLDEPGQASMGGADLEVSRVEFRVSDSSPLGQDVSPEAQPDVQVELLSPVPEEKPVEDELGATLEEKLQPEWEQERSEQVFPPSVEYSWPRDHPDSFTWMNAALATSKYLAARAVAEDPAQLWVHELAPDHRDLATAQVVIGVQVPTGLITPRESVAILQTMLYEAGFQFQNLVPVLFRAHAAKVSPGVIRSLVRPALEAQERNEPPQALDYHPEDEDEDLIMSDVNLLGRTYVLRRTGSSISSGAAEALVSILHQVQQLSAAVSRQDEKVSVAPTPGMSTDRLQLGTPHLGEGRETKGLSPIAGQPGNVTRQTQRDVEAEVQVAAHRAAQAERMRIEAAIAQYVQQQQAGAETKMQAERAVWEAQTRQSMEELELRLKESEAARMKDQRTAKNILEFHVRQLRDLRATSAE
ncbi:hypothetical protein PHMEG_00031849, partial [Phytophthora megakarya]